MTVLEILASVLIIAGTVLAVVAAIGLNRFNDVLTRIHSASKPQTLGLMLVLAGAALAAGSWSLAAMLLVVMLAQMTTVPVASVMVGRAAFRRGFVRGGQYAVDDLSPRLADVDDQDDDEDGFIDEGVDDHEGLTGGEERFPENVVDTDTAASDLSLPNWEEPEAGAGDSDDEDLDVDLADETEREAEEVAERDRR